MGQVKELWLSKRMQVDPAISISLVAIDGKCLGADRELKHPESTGIAVRASDRLEAPLSLQRDEGLRCQAGETFSCPDMDPGPDGKVTTWSRPSG